MYNILYVQVSRPDQTDEAFHRLTRLGKFALALVNGPTGRESAISSQISAEPRRSYTVDSRPATNPQRSPERFFLCFAIPSVV